MNARHLLAAAVLAMTTATVTAADLPVTTKVLPNGCTLAVVENHQAPVVALRIYVRNTGSLYEGEFLGCGISHYYEHLVHGGTTPKRTEAESARLLQSIGGETNAYTTRDLTCYHGQTHVGSFDLMLDLFSDWVQNCALDPREVEREKGVIIKELIKDLDEPDRVAYQLLMDTMFRVHPVRHPTIGYRENFERITRDDLVRFYRDRYAPNNTVVVVGGDVDPAEILGKLEKAFGGWRRRPEVDLSSNLPPEPRQTVRRFAEQELDVREAILRFGFHTIELSHPDLYALDLLAAVLGHGRTSRLHRRLVERDQVTDGVSVGSYTPHYGAGVFHVIVQGPYEKAPHVERALFEEIGRLAKAPPTAEELERAKTLVERDFVMGQLSAVDQATSAAIDLMGTGDPNFSARYVERIRIVTGEQVSAMARKYLRRENETLIVLRPRGVPSAFEAEAGPEELAVCPDHRQVRRPGGGRCPLCGKDLVLPGRSGERGTRKVVLDNGLTVLIQRNPATPTVGIEAFFRAGVLWETEETSGLTNLVARLLMRGTSLRDAATIAEQLENIGASMSTSSGNNTVYGSMTLLARDLEVGLGIYADVLRNPSFLEKEVEREKQISRLLIRRQANSWESEAVRFFRQAMFATHPYRRDRFGTLASIDRADRDAVVAHYTGSVRPDNGVLAVFGDVDPDAAERLVRAAFAGWKADGPAATVETPVEPPLGESRTEVQPTDKGQVVITLGFPGATLDDDDRHVLQVIDAAISGLGLPSGRLHEALRGEHDYVYYVHAINWNGFGTGSFYVMCPCRPDLYDEVLKIIRREIARVAEEGLEPEELENAKRMCVTVGQLDRQTNNERAQECVLDELYGFGWDASARTAEKIGSVTNEDVKRVAKAKFANSVLALTAPREWLKQRGMMKDDEK